MARLVWSFGLLTTSIMLLHLVAAQVRPPMPPPQLSPQPPVQAPKHHTPVGPSLRQIFYGSTNAPHNATFLVRTNPTLGNYSSSVLSTYPRNVGITKLAYNPTHNVLYAEVPGAVGQHIPIQTIDAATGRLISTFNKPWPGSDCLLYATNNSRLTSLRIDSSENILFWSMYNLNNPGMPTSAKFDLRDVDKESSWQLKACVYNPRFNWVFILARARHYHILALDLAGRGAVREGYIIDNVNGTDQIIAIGAESTTSDLYSILMKKESQNIQRPYLARIVLPPASGTSHAVLHSVGSNHFSVDHVTDGIVDYHIGIFYAVADTPAGATFIPVDLNTGMPKYQPLVADGFYHAVGTTLGGL